MKNVAQTWYVRRDGKLKGPFAAGLISRYLLLGRIKETDEVSSDRAEWQLLAAVDDLIPRVWRDAKASPDDPDVQARLAAARRWADERRETRGGPPGAERRKPEPLETVALREGRVVRPPEPKRRSVIEYAAVAALVAVVVGTPFLMPRIGANTSAQCEAPPGPKVVWNNCLMPGRELANVDLSGADLRSVDLNSAILRGADLRAADLSYGNFTLANLRGANLSSARLTGATLRGADLSAADLTGADLSYAILSGAFLADVNLAGARLDHAQWGQGIECLPGSIGECLQATTAPE